MLIAPKFECKIIFHGNKSNILKLENDIRQAVVEGDSIVNFRQRPNLTILLDNIGFDYVEYYENEKIRLWNVYKSRGIGISAGDFLIVFREDLKTNFDANFNDFRIEKDKTGTFSLIVTMIFRKVVDPRILVLLTQIYGLDSYQYVGYEPVRMIAQKGSYNIELPDLSYAIHATSFNNNVFKSSTIYTNEKYEEGEELFDGYKCMYSTPLQNEETPPLILGMYYIEEDDDE